LPQTLTESLVKNTVNLYIYKQGFTQNVLLNSLSQELDATSRSSPLKTKYGFPTENRFFILKGCVEAAHSVTHL